MGEPRPTRFLPHGRDVRRLVAWVGLGLLAAVRAPEAQQIWPSQVIPTDVWLRMWEQRPPEIGEIVLDAPVDSVWTALRATLQSLHVPVGFDDPKLGEIGHTRAKLYKRMGKQPLSHYLSCGTGITGPNADSYVVYLSFVTMVKPENGKARVVPLLTGLAVDIPSGRNDGVNCVSTGRLETRIGEDLRKRIGGGQGA
jgi:hypothetical protein